MAALMRPWSGVPDCFPPRLLRNASSAAAAPPVDGDQNLDGGPARLQRRLEHLHPARVSQGRRVLQSRCRSRSSGAGRVSMYAMSRSMDTSVWPAAFTLVSSDVMMLRRSSVGGLDAVTAL